MSLTEITDKAVGQFAKMFLGLAVSAFLAGLGWIGTNINTHLNNQDILLRSHGELLSSVKTTVEDLKEGQAQTRLQLEGVVKAQAEQAIKGAEVKQRLDDFNARPLPR